MMSSYFNVNFGFHRCFAVAAIAVSVSILNAQDLLVHYPFNGGFGDTAKDSTKTRLDLLLLGGMNWSAEGQGLRGSGFAIRNGASLRTSDSVAINTSTGVNFDSLTRYTLTGWFNAGATQNGGRLFSFGNPQTSESALELYFVGPENDRLVVQAGPTLAMSDGSYGAKDRWVFFAVAVDTTARGKRSGVSFYIGFENTPASQVSVKSQNGTASSMGTEDIETIAVGNWSNVTPRKSKDNRSLIKMNLADFRVYSEALDEIQIENVRTDALSTLQSGPAP